METRSVLGVLNALAGRLSDSTMQRLNYEADEKGRKAADIARGFLVESGLIEADARAGGGPVQRGIAVLAGGFEIDPALDEELDEFRDVIELNVTAVWHLSKLFGVGMVAAGSGSIINIASIDGKRGGGIFGNTLYATSKAGVIGLSKGLAREGGPYGINVNAICPGLRQGPVPSRGFSSTRQCPILPRHRDCAADTP